MAYTKKTVKSKKKVYKKKPAPKTSGTTKIDYPKSIVNFGSSFPMKAMIKQVYTDTVMMTSTTGILAHYTMSLNGLFDPNITACGHQPLYFDQMMAIYNHYVVIASKITVKLIPLEANTVPTIVALWQNDDTSITSTSMINIQEQSGSSSTICGSQGDNYTTLNLKYSPKKVFGGSVLGNANLKGSASANPPEQTYGVLSIVGADYLTTVNVIAQIVVEYVSIFSELKDIVGS